LLNGRYFYADGQSVPTATCSMPRRYCADGYRQHRPVLTTMQAVPIDWSRSEACYCILVLSNPAHKVTATLPVSSSGIGNHARRDLASLIKNNKLH
jgi:hypothetical protein